MTRQGAKEMMLKGYKVTHDTFRTYEYIHVILGKGIRTETDTIFNDFYLNDKYKTNWSVFDEHNVIKNNMKYTINDLREGNVAIAYEPNCNLILLTKVLKKAFPNHLSEPMGTCRYYLQRTNSETWLASQSKPTIPVQKLEDFEESLYDERFPFQLSIDDARKIIGIACTEWQKKLLSKWDRVLITGFVQVDEDFYTEMRKACTAEQNKLFDKIFGEDYQVDWKPNHVYLVKAGPGLRIRVSSEGKGWFYNEGYLKGNTTYYRADEIEKLIGPV